MLISPSQNPEALLDQGGVRQVYRDDRKLTGKNRRVCRHSPLCGQERVGHHHQKEVSDWGLDLMSQSHHIRPKQSIGVDAFNHSLHSII